MRIKTHLVVGQYAGDNSSRHRVEASSRYSLSRSCSGSVHQASADTPNLPPEVEFREILTRTLACNLSSQRSLLEKQPEPSNS